ncbi:hypothetical protein E0H75_21865 [Kribbella capetownensis]|uniref:Uncharacterized protein n=1 Tax=Kribbella capetownensis TaxID=1572659 RepID=A0A4R0JYH3_9ACTN|nr:hypothetical protein [Kribbella capetownensis]TCC47435.1 hypothetical protein E0H75_21865 [Kribbella capetownensis]
MAKKTTAAPVDVGFVGLCISLGPRAGIFQFARRDDTAINFYLGGRLGVRVKDSRRRQLLQAQRGSVAVHRRVEG